MNYDIKQLVIDHNPNHETLIYILPSSDKAQKLSLEELARYFKNESRYTHLQYCREDENTDCIGFLITKRAPDLVRDMDHHPYKIVGGGCFREGQNGEYCLDWIWIHPYERNRGNLERLWPEFESRFGKFGLTLPVSKQMMGFLKKKILTN